MNKEELFRQIDRLEQSARSSRLQRFSGTPGRYLSAAFFNKLIYPITHKECKADTTTFFDSKIRIALPAGTDLYLIGGKSHDSEIRLARFITSFLESGECFVDVGAHFGYFSLLASKIVANKGRVLSFEAASRNFELLKENCRGLANIELFNNAVSDSREMLTFYEFPALYSEYNTVDVSQFKQESWFKKYKPTQTQVQSLTLDEVLEEKKIVPAVVKIDVEGAEFKVINGMKKTLSENPVVVVMEYLHPSRHNTAHQKAAELLKNLGFEQYIIIRTGDLKQIDGIDEYLVRENLDSENLVFKKSS